mmetsp:Transcript_14447/g.61992  ORF Transcript_14447/g.61992 Transcript_14447/m.61992 type:complete len:377 (+) Transcript_14447:2610-3740(+)
MIHRFFRASRLRVPSPCPRDTAPFASLVIRIMYLHDSLSYVCLVFTLALAVEAGEVGERGGDDAGDEHLLVEQVPHRHLHLEHLEDDVGHVVGQTEGHRERADDQRERAEEPLVVVPHRGVLVDVGARPGVHVHQLHEHAEHVENGGVDDRLQRADLAGGEERHEKRRHGDGDVHLLVLQRRLRRDRRPRPEQRHGVRLQNAAVHGGHVAAQPRLKARLHDGLVRRLHRRQLLGLGFVQQLLAIERLLDRIRVRALRDAERLPGVGVTSSAARRGGRARRDKGAAGRAHRRRAASAEHRRGGGDALFGNLRGGAVAGVALRAGTRAGRPRDGHRGGGGGERHHLAETDERVATSAEVMNDPRCVRGSEAFDGSGRT